jgi:acyl-CoA hydrolase
MGTRKIEPPGSISSIINIKTITDLAHHMPQMVIAEQGNTVDKSLDVIADIGML